MTRPGAGGSIVTEFNNQKDRVYRSEADTKESSQESSDMSDEKTLTVNMEESSIRKAFATLFEEMSNQQSAQIEEVTGELTRLREAHTKSENLRVMESSIRGFEIPQGMAARVVEVVSADSRMTESNADVQDITKKAVEAEMKYIRSVSPTFGMQYAPDRDLNAEESQKEFQVSLNDIFGYEPEDEE